MLNAIIQFSLKNKLIVILAVLALVIAGIINLTRLSIDALPDITSNQVQVITSSPSLAAPEIERLVTFTVEQQCANIQGITQMRSISRFGLSVVTIVFDDNVDIYWARQQVAERLGDIKENIPQSAGTPIMAPLTTGLGEVYQYIVKPAPGYESKYDLADLRTIQDWIIRRQLLGTPGVADVSSFGGNLKQYEIAFTPQKLNAMNVTLDELYTALAENNENSGGSYIEKNNQALFIRTEGLLQNISDIQNVVVKTNPGGNPVFVRDVATVQIGRARRYGALVDGSKGEVSGAVVLMLKGANGLQVINQLKKKMEQVSKILPEGIVVEVFYDRSKLVNRAIKTVQKNLAEGALIVIFILVLFLGNLRAGLIVASVIPLAMLFAIIMMNLFKVSGNLMSLGALDFGLIVDGAVIIVEAVLHQLHVRHHKLGPTQLTAAEMDREVGRSASKMMNSAMFGQIIILIVYFPILALVGVEGKMFRPMAQTVSFALIGAALLSLTYVPVMTSLGLNKKLQFKLSLADRFMNWLEKMYLPALRFGIKKKWAILGSVLLVFLFSLLIMNRLGGEFIPEMEEGDFAVDTRLLTGASLESSIDYAQKAAALLEQNFPEVEKIVSRVGASEIPTDPMPIEMGDLIILLKDKKTWTSAQSFDEMADTMSRVLERIPGLSAGFQFPVQMRFNELISGARQDVVVKIFGEDLDTLAAYAARIGHVVEKVEGASDVYVESVTGLPQVAVKMDRNAMALYGVSAVQINNAVLSGFAGRSAGLIYENEQRYDMVVRLDKSQRSGVEDVEKILIQTGLGGSIPLHQLARIEVSEGPNQIQRENAKRRIMVAFNVRGKDVESVVNDLESRINAEVKMPPGYLIHYGGAFENLKTATTRLAIAVPAALVLILLLLYFAFGKMKYALLIFTAIPLSAIGGIFALWTRGMPFSISAGVGFIALFGVAVLNGIVLIAEFNRQRELEGMKPIQAVIRGTVTRLRPVLMTASVASFGFLPMALSTSPGAEVQRPLATVVIGGLISATFLTLMVLPLLYLLMEEGKLKFRRVRKSVGVIAVLMALSLQVQAQETRYSRQEILNLLPQKNLELTGYSLEQKALNTMLESAGQQPGLTLVSEFGQINAPPFDVKLSAVHTFLPKGYAAAQRSGFQTDLNMAKSRFTLRQAELRYFASSQVNELLYQQEVIRYLQFADSLYSKLVRLATLRLQHGETGGLELAGFEMNKAKWEQEKMQALLQEEVAGTQLATLLQMKEVVRVSDSFHLMLPPSALAAAGGLHPALFIHQLEIERLKNEYDLQKAALRPSLEIGLINQSFTGWYADKNQAERYNNFGNRFFGGQFGINIPIFRKPYLKKLEALELKQDFAEAQLNNALLQWEMNKSLAQKRMATSVQRLRELEGKWLKSADRVLSLAGQQLDAGELNFISWMALVEPALAVKLNYLEMVKEINQHYYYWLYLNEK